MPIITLETLSDSPYSREGAMLTPEQLESGQYLAIEATGVCVLVAQIFGGQLVR
jgi:hypothetical protein